MNYRIIKSEQKQTVYEILFSSSPTDLLLSPEEIAYMQRIQREWEEVQERLQELTEDGEKI